MKIPMPAEWVTHLIVHDMIQDAGYAQAMST